ncbi:unnamed protein product [Amoebophrya sp. A25]|nr:unnamed protein product [Amoebophrya sp. A25]|eukprot:GSA25T00000640001.1
MKLLEISIASAGDDGHGASAAGADAILIVVGAIVLFFSVIVIGAAHMKTGFLNKWLGRGSDEISPLQLSRVKQKEKTKANCPTLQTEEGESNSETASVGQVRVEERPAGEGKNVPIKSNCKSILKMNKRT